MKTLFKDPLFYKEWKNSKWICILMTLILFWHKVNYISSQLDFFKDTTKGNQAMFDKMWFNKYLLSSGTDGIMLMAGPTLLLCILLFKGEKQDSTCDLLHSMPFTRKDIIISKIKVGILTITIPFLINFILLTCFYLNNKSYIGTSYMDIPKFYSINLLFILFFFVFLVFMETIVGQYFAAVVFSPIILTVPYMLTSYVVDLIRFTQGLQYDAFKFVSISKISENLFIYGIIQSKPLLIDKKDINGEIIRDVDKLIYENFNIKIMILIVLIVVFSILAVIIYKKVKLERVNKLIIFKPIETIFKWGVAICVGMIFSQIFGYPHKPEESANMPLIYTTLVIGTVIGYFISKLALKFSNR
ncbi:ABC-2 transporter permease [Clostridium sp. Marseille-Q2269]|uniref:ABC-2 transporter permease n=1 Tax=Clostridium sp. Marseille-Q2269 TaxID=2942205 RepID=UPI0020745612|nr:ABC-2 transporter permease [Clostridium sp. Marseille-Q2269]